MRRESGLLLGEPAGIPKPGWVPVPMMTATAGRTLDLAVRPIGGVMNPTTDQNLAAAMRDEAFAFGRYALYSRQAQARGNTELAELFDSFADTEVFDSFVAEGEGSDRGAGSDVEHVQEAIAAESRGADETYHLFEQQARDMGDARIAERFAGIRARKRRRWARLAAALETLEAAEPQPHRILVIANETCQGSGLCDEISYRAGRIPSDVLIVAPTLTKSRLHYYASDLDHEREQATERIDTLRTELKQHRVHTKGRIGDADPIVAIEDALREFPADEIVIATHPPESSVWLERNLVHQARVRFDPLLITHVVVAPTVESGVVLPGD